MLSNNPLEYVYMIIIGMAAVTYFSRELPFVILKGKKLNSSIVEWMGYVPIAVLAALLIPALLIDGESKKLFISLRDFFFFLVTPVKISRKVLLQTFSMFIISNSMPAFLT